MSQPDPPRLPDDLLARLAGHGDLRSFAAGDILVAEGDHDERVFILVSGRLRVFTSGGNDREFVYNVIHRPGEIFGEMGLDGGVRSASVQAMEASDCVVIERPDLRGFMQAHPELAEHLLLALIGRLRRATGQIKGLVLSDVYERTVAVLRAEAIIEEGARILPKSLTQKEIAARVGATREMVGQIVRDLQRGGYLVRDASKRFVIHKEFPKGW